MTALEPCLCGDPACGRCFPGGAPDDRAPPEVHLVMAHGGDDHQTEGRVVAAYTERMDAELRRDRARRAQAAAPPTCDWINPEDPYFHPRLWWHAAARGGLPMKRAHYNYSVITLPLISPDQD